LTHFRFQICRFSHISSILVKKSIFLEKIFLKS
jgi:hypothetical protein